MGDVIKIYAKCVFGHGIDDEVSGRITHGDTVFTVSTHLFCMSFFSLKFQDRENSL